MYIHMFIVIPFSISTQQASLGLLVLVMVQFLVLLEASFRGGWQGAITGAGAGALVGFANPFFAANAVGAAAGAGIASLIGQGAGNLVSGKDVTNICNYDFSAAAGAALGGALGGPLGNFLGRYVGPYRFPIVGRPLNAPGISKAPGNTVGSIVEGVSVGTGELAGQKF